MDQYVHRMLDSGVEFAAVLLPGRRTAAIEFQVLSGMADEPDDKLGLAHLVEQTISKGTRRRDARALADAFDSLGARRSSWVGRETYGFACLCLPQFLPQVIELHAEMLRQPVFPDQACRVAIDLARQELTALHDEPLELLRKLLARQAYGPRLGRHHLGEPDTLARIDPDEIRNHWARHFCAGRLQVAVAGPVEPDRLASQLDRAFGGFGSPSPAGRQPQPLQFSSTRTHHPQQLEQQYIGICFPGVPVDHPDHPVERVLIGILSGGMSARLFTEIREKQGLVYWVGAWHEHPRAAGMIHLGASTVPQRCDQTLAALLNEIDRLSDDLTEAELSRAITGIVARTQTRGETTHARATELADDLFYYGHPVPIEDKLRQVQQVDIPRIKRYLTDHPRDQLCVVTLGPRALS
ncbi:MAG: M16 family metallopeptidase [Phycisphaerae bacterium]